MAGEILREYATDAIRYWEPRRVIYNLALAAIVLAYFLIYGIKTRSYSLNLALILVILGVLANVAYCAAYIVDIFAQMSGFRDQWRKYRWILFSIGLVFAAILTRFWSIGIFGGER